MSASPDLTQKVIGYRAWRFGEDGKLRASGTDDTPWSDGVETAACRKGAYDFHRAIVPGCACASCSKPPPAPKHEAPAHDCQCGIYAMHEPGRGYFDPSYGSTHILGAVAAWGRMEVHHGGIRAQFAQPIVLAYADYSTVGMMKRAQEYGRSHGLKVVHVDELVGHAQMYGAPVPLSLRPEKPKTVDLDFKVSASNLLSAALASQWQSHYAWGYGSKRPPAPSPKRECVECGNKIKSTARGDRCANCPSHSRHPRYMGFGGVV